MSVREYLCVSPSYVNKMVYLYISVLYRWHDFSVYLSSCHLPGWWEIPSPACYSCVPARVELWVPLWPASRDSALSQLPCCPEQHWSGVTPLFPCVHNNKCKSQTSYWNLWWFSYYLIYFYAEWKWIHTYTSYQELSVDPELFLVRPPNHSVTKSRTISIKNKRKWLNLCGFLYTYM